MERRCRDPPRSMRAAQRPMDARSRLRDPRGAREPAAVRDPQGIRRHVPADLPEADHRSSTRSSSGPSIRASAAGTCCTGTRTGSRNASAARSARPPARPTASASWPPRTPPDNRVSAGERYARIYEINMSRCIFCGYCELACPFDAITLGNQFEISEYSRDDLIYTKDMLLDRADQARSGPGPRPLRHPDPGLQDLRPDGQLPRLGDLDRGRARVPRDRPRRRHLHEPVLLGARADRQSRLARRALPARLRGVRRGSADPRLRRRGDGDVPLRDRLPRRPGRRALGRRADAGSSSAPSSSARRS